MYWVDDEDKYLCFLSYKNGGAIYCEVMCSFQDAFLQVTGNLIHSGLNKEENLSATETEKPRGKASFEIG